MDSRTYCATSNGRREWQRSLDSQDFGFASNLMDSSDVAPADELFFKGQLMPLLQDQRTYLVQSLCSSSSIEDEQEEFRPLRASARLESRNFPTSSRLGDGAVDLDARKPEQDAESSLVDGLLHKRMHSLQSCEDSPSFIKEREELQTWNLTADAGDCDIRASAISSSVHRSGDYGVLSWDEGKECTSCNNDLDMPSSKTGTGTDGFTDLRSLSFRSHNSGFWDSGTDKDVMDSSSSRDSNGSSQDSYSNHCKALQAPLPDHLHCRSISSFSITNWKSGTLKQNARRKETIPQNFSVTTVFTEELGKHTPEAELALLPLKNYTDDSNEGDRKQTNPRGRMSSSSSAAIDKSELNTMNASRTAAEDAGSKELFSSQGRLMDSKDSSLSTGASADIRGGVKAKNQKSMAARKRWQMYARRLKPLCEMKLWMGQFGMMDDCGKRAYYEVQHGTTIVIPSSRRASAANGQLLMRRSHQLSSANSAASSHGTSLSQQKQVNPQPAKLLAVSSCPSTISSPNHSGVLEYLDSIPKIPNPLKPANCVKAHCKIPNIPLKSHSNAGHAPSGSIKGGIQCSGSPLDGCSNNYRSMSTMQELHSAVQSAIAHCKESNKNLVMDDLAAAD